MLPVREGEAPAELGGVKLGGSFALPNPELLRLFRFLNSARKAIVTIFQGKVMFANEGRVGASKGDPVTRGLSKCFDTQRVNGNMLQLLLSFSRRAPGRRLV